MQNINEKQLSDFKRNKHGGIDATWSHGPEFLPYTLTTDEESLVTEPVADYDESSYIALYETSNQKALEQTKKLSAYEFKGVMCSVCEDDQNGWESLSSRIKRELERGTDWRPIPFFMENGNHVVLDTLDEWESFVDAGWAARDVIMLARLA